MFKAFLIDGAHFTIGEDVYQEWVNVLAQHVIASNGYKVYGSSEKKRVVILDPDQVHPHSWLTPLGYSEYYHCLAHNTFFVQQMKRITDEHGIMDPDTAVEFSFGVLEELVEDQALKDIVLKHHLHHEQIKKGYQCLARNRQLDSLRQQAVEVGFEPNFFCTSKNELFYVFDDLYKVPENEEDPKLCDPKHLVAKEIVDFC